MKQTYESSEVKIRRALPKEFDTLGQLMVRVYAQLPNFPSPTEQPKYYEMLAHIGDFTTKPQTNLLVAVDANDNILGGVVFFGDMQYYGSGGIATKELHAGGFRLLAVDPNHRKLGVGKLLVNACIQRAASLGLRQVIIHSTKSMQTAWTMYEKMGFRRAEELDFIQGELPVYGFRLPLTVIMH